MKLSDQKWFKILRQVAPALATAFGGPAAGLAVGAISKAVGKPADEITDEYLEEMTANSETLVKLREINKNFEKEMAELNVRLEELEVEDRKSARRFASETIVAPQVVLSSIFVIVYGGVLWYLFAEEWSFSPNQQTIVSMVLGVLTSSVVQIMNFWFGSSKGSKDKTAIMANGNR